MAYFDEESKKPTPNIAYMGISTFAFRKDIATALVDILEDAGELLPFYVEDELWYCLNVLKQYPNALNKEKSEYKVNDGSVKFGLKKHAFNTEAIAESALFKIPTDNFTSIFCADKRETDEDVLNNFFCAIANYKYTGIKFEEVYSD